MKGAWNGHSNKHKTHPDLYRHCLWRPLDRASGHLLDGPDGGPGEGRVGCGSLPGILPGPGERRYPPDHEGRVEEPLAVAEIQARLAVLPGSLPAAAPDGDRGWGDFLPALPAVLRP